MGCRHRTSRAFAWLVLGGYVLVASGIVVPIAESVPEAGSPAASRLADKDRGRPFPCMDKPCGCATAEQCFSSCCCNTPAELLAWAEAHRLDPATVRLLERRAVATAAAVTPALHAAPAAAAPCCATTSARAADVCDAYQSLAAEPPCCATAVTPQEPPRPIEDDDRRDAAPRRTIVSFRAMLACGGILAGWSATALALPAPPAVACAMDESRGDLLVLADDVGLSADPHSDTPPPRA